MQKISLSLSNNQKVKNNHKKYNNLYNKLKVNLNKSKAIFKAK